MNFFTLARKNAVNIPGWRTKRKILVIESDDWGSVSIPSKKIYNYLLNKGLPVDEGYFTRYDCLENQDDFIALFDVLSGFKDYKGNFPCITLNTIVANPDFERIADSKCQNYYYEDFTETYKRYPGHSDTFELFKSGMKSHFIWPQFHGREHLNSIEWLRVINSGDKNEVEAFRSGAILEMLNPIVSKRKMGYLAAFDYENMDEMRSFENVIREGCNIFNALFGFYSSTFVAPTSIRSDKIDKYLSDSHIQFHQVGQQILPAYEGYKRKNRFWGERNRYGQIYWRRNGKFEPSSNSNIDWVDRTLYDISIAFRWGKPAVINSHRVNYIGSLVPENRHNTLRILKSLLQKVVRTFPDIEFMSSDQLGQEIIGGN